MSCSLGNGTWVVNTVCVNDPPVTTSCTSTYASGEFVSAIGSIFDFNEATNQVVITPYNSSTPSAPIAYTFVDNVMTVVLLDPAYNTYSVNISQDCTSMIWSLTDPITGFVYQIFFTNTSTNIPAQTDLDKLENFIASKQCCVAGNTYDTFQQLQIGNRSVKCKVKEAIFANIVLEILSDVNPYGSKACSKITNYVQSINGANEVTVYVDGVDITNGAVPNPGLGATQYALDVISAINNYSSTSGFEAYLDNNDFNFSICSSAIGEDNNGSVITAIDDLDVSYLFDTQILSGGSEDDSDSCLTLEEICAMTSYLDKICDEC